MYTNPGRMALISLAIGLGPVATLLTITLIAGLLGCELDEAAVNSCMMAGVDTGPALSILSLTVVVLLVISVPIMIAGLIGALIWMLWIWYRQPR